MQLIDSDIKTREVLDWQGLHLFHYQGSTCSQKTRIFLNLKGINWTPHHIDLARQENYDPWYLGINPRGLVPVLVHHGKVHIESNDILTYLDETFPEPPLIPADQRDEMQTALKEEDDLHEDLRTLTMRFFVPKLLAKKSQASMETFEENDGTIQGETDPHKIHEVKWWAEFNQHGVTDDQARSAAGRFKQVYDRFDQHLQTEPYLAGKDLTLLDIAWFIYTHRLSAAGYPFAKLHPAVFTWFTKLSQRPEFSKELNTPVPLKVVTGALHMVQAVRGTTLEKVAGFA